MGAEKGRMFSGARARLHFNGKPIGYARNCNGREEITYSPERVMGNIQVKEHVPVQYDTAFSAGFIRIVGETSKSEGYFPKLGQNSDDHLTNILTSGDLTVTIEDSKTGLIVSTLEQVKAASNNWSIDAGGVVGYDMDFVAIRSRDESEV